MWCRVLSVLVLLALWSSAGYAKRECNLRRYAEIPVTMQDMRPLVRGTINGKPARFMLDNGAMYSMILGSSVKKFGVRTLERTGSVNTEYGPEPASLVRAKDFSLDGLFNGRVFHHVEFIVARWLVTDEYDGLIGQNIYGSSDRGDIEYDLADGVIRIFAVQGCRHANLAYWAGKARIASMDYHHDRMNHQIIGSALLDGKKIRVLFDTGTSYSSLTLKAARRVGIKLREEDGAGRHNLKVWVARFDSLDLGGEVIKNARLHVSNRKAMGADLILGADFFLSHRIFISNSQHRIYFTYNGGPVFDFRKFNVKAELAASASHGSSAQKSTVKDTDPSSLRRRAIALVERHEYARALADLDSLIKLAPYNADNYLQRAQAYISNQQPKRALSDLDQALKIKPDLTNALLARGTIRLKRGDDSGADEDFDAAKKSAPGDWMIVWRVGHAYLSENRFDRAITQFDSWITANPKDERLPFVLAQRCLARALVDKQLKLALDDCKSARRQVRDDPLFLSSTALVYMRLGKYHKAVKYYKKSTDLQPKNAWVLYGLGLAEERDGSKVDGARSIRSALALKPDVAKSYKKIGLQPLIRASSASMAASP